MDAFSRILNNFLPRILREYVRLLWSTRYPGAVWKDTRESGDELLHGRGSYELLLCYATVQWGSKFSQPLGPRGEAGAERPMDLVRDDCRVHIKGKDGDESVVPKAESFVTWLGPMDRRGFGSFGAPFKPRTWSTGVYWERNKGMPAPTAVVEVFGRDQAFYRRQFSNSIIGSWQRARDALQTGISDTLDITLLLWVLLNSGHDGQDPSMGGDGNPVNSCRGLVHCIPGVSDKSVDALRAALAGVREVRNQSYGHVAAWRMDSDQFCLAVNVVMDVARAMDAVAVELGWNVERFEDRADR